ncbi:vWA domain-containing protein [Jannaschia marina]|uniref:vWA domain-containing protein n=1 Tax=Jannaschia marina TaxID=2741674 RepID=UPI002E2B2B8F|nr:vWA domain-containing protein [Jannaschia marina]
MTARAALAGALSVALAAAPVAADCTRDAMIVFDGSASMGERGFDGGTARRIDEARSALARALPAAEGLRRVGLLTYGPGPEGSCDSVRLRFAPVPNATAPILEAIDRFQPLGMTPLTEAVRTAATALSPPATIVLLTDGNDTCDGAPCALGAALARDTPGLTVHVIGFGRTAETLAGDPLARGRGLDEAQIRCLADATGGLFAVAATVEDLTAALTETLGCPLIGWNENTPALANRGVEF